jgi:predicted ArsR family transcriptional regulator
MMDAFGDRQQDLLKLLLKKKYGLTIEEISEELGITRPAIRQHLVALERQGFVERGSLLLTGGRPGQTYKLTDKGYNLFPKQYSWFSEVLLESLKTQLGSEGLSEMMKKLGTDIGRDVAEQVQSDSLKSKVERTAKLMNDLAYQAETSLTGKELPGAPPVIEATNCVFHNLAVRFPEVCNFDIALLAKITGANVIHEQCMIRGSSVCRFRFKAK